MTLALNTFKLIFLCVKLFWTLPAGWVGVSRVKYLGRLVTSLVIVTALKPSQSIGDKETYILQKGVVVSWKGLLSSK